MKIIQSILVDTMFGPIGNLVAYPGPLPGTATIQRRNRRTDKSHHNKSCKAFKIADNCYHLKTECERYLWRTAQCVRKKSGYDLFMMHAVKNIAAGLLPPAIPPNPAGFAYQHAPPGPYWIDSPDIPMIPNQTCFGPVAWDWSRGYCLDINIDLTLDLRHHDDANPFDLLLSYWLLWNNTTNTWAKTGTLQLVPNNYDTRFTIHDVDPATTFTNVGIIEIAYANLRQKFVIAPAQILNIPLHPCTAPTSQFASANPLRPPYGAHYNPLAWPRDSGVLFKARKELLASSRTLQHYRCEPLTLISDHAGAIPNAANIHIVGLFEPAFKAHLWNYHTTKPLYKPRVEYFPHPQTFNDTGRTIILYAGVIYSLSWTTNRTLTFTMTTPPETPENP